MTLTADAKGRLTCRDFFKPGTSYDVAKTDSGGIVLRELVIKRDEPPKVRMVRKDGFTMLMSDRVITDEDVRKVLDEFP